MIRKTMYTMNSGSNVTCQFSDQPKRVAKGADESRLAIRDRGISTIFADWKQTGNICGRSDKARVFTNFYTALGKQRRFHEVALHLEPPCRLMTFSYRFPGIFHSVSPLYSLTINPTAAAAAAPCRAGVCRTARHRSSYVHNHRVRSVVRYAGDRRTMLKQRVGLAYDNVVAAIKFPG